MKQFLFLIGSIGGFWMLAQRYRRGAGARKVMSVGTGRGTPINVGDGSLWVESPGIDEGAVWQQSPFRLRSASGEGTLAGADILVNGTPISVPDAAGEAVITVVYNGAATLTISTPETDDGHVNIDWAEPSKNGFGSSDWHASPGKWTYRGGSRGERITRILVDGASWYHAKDHDTPQRKAQCELRLRYVFGALEP